MSTVRKIPLKYIACASALGFAAFKVIRFLQSREKDDNKIILISSDLEWIEHESEILEHFRKSKIIGLDCEWVTEKNKRNPVSLLQLGTSTGFCVLIRLSLLPIYTLDALLGSVLRDRTILKVGVSIYEDTKYLFQDYGLEVYNFVDLRHLVGEINELKDKPLSLKNISLNLLDINLDKNVHIRCSHWDTDNLSEEQINYAANDAIISAKIFDEIIIRKRRLFLPSDVWKEVEAHIDRPYKLKNVAISSKTTANLSIGRKSRFPKPMSKQLYDNCKLLAPDGELLCSCNRRKAEWYVSMGLGTLITEDPLTVQLNFEPSDRPKLDNAFYTIEKANCCVVCGNADEGLNRKFIVPSEYRHHFPDLMKKYLSHDVLLHCIRCHQRANILDQRMREKLAVKCDAPLSWPVEYDRKLTSVKSAASALLNTKVNIPEARKQQLRQRIEEHYGVDSVTEELLRDVLQLDIVIKQEHAQHGLKVFQYYCQNSGLFAFVRMWRQHFLDTMKPQFLPEMWSVDHNQQRLALQILNNERKPDFDPAILGVDFDALKASEEKQDSG